MSRARRRIGRIVVVTLVFTVGVELGDAALHAVQEVGAFRLAAGATDQREPVPCPALGGLPVYGMPQRLLRFFRLDREAEFMKQRAPRCVLRD